LGQPSLADWLESLNAAIESAEGEIIIVAHSLACSLISHWSKENKTHKIAGALLVAPADVDLKAHPDQIRNFSYSFIKVGLSFHFNNQF
jgi:predicted alpha/beta hydrolase family esterase